MRIVNSNLTNYLPEFLSGKVVISIKERDIYTVKWEFVCWSIVSSKVDFHQSGIEKGTRERVRSKVAKFGYHYKFLSSF